MRSATAQAEPLQLDLRPGPAVLARIVIEGPPATKKNRPQPIWPAIQKRKLRDGEGKKVRGLTAYFGWLRGLAAGLGAQTWAVEDEEWDEDFAPTVESVAEELAWAEEHVRSLPLPSSDFRKYARTALPQLRAGWRAAGYREPYGGPVQVEAIYYLGKGQRPDLLGLEDATADLIQAAGIVKNDYWIVGWDGSRKDRDADRPRVEIVIREAAA